MQQNIIVSGVGGQGILSIAAVIDLAALHCGLTIHQTEVHGMSQRGGAVQSHLRISDAEIHSGLITEGTADIILSVEPLEALRYLHFLSPGGRIVTATETVVNMAGYPPFELIEAELLRTGSPVLVDAAALAREAGSTKTSNMVMLGATAPFLAIDQEHLESGIMELFGPKGEKIVAMNIDAFRKGVAFSQQSIQQTVL